MADAFIGKDDRRIALFNVTEQPWSRSREQSYEWGRAAGEQAAALALDRPDRPTAVIALSDNLALGFLDAMTPRGLRPGTDITLTGFDDIPEAARVGLTTVRQPIRDKGYRTAELLLDPAAQPRRVTLPHTLVVRTSSGPHRTDRLSPQGD